MDMVNKLAELDEHGISEKVLRLIIRVALLLNTKEKRSMRVEIVTVSGDQTRCVHEMFCFILKIKYFSFRYIVFLT